MKAKVLMLALGLSLTGCNGQQETKQRPQLAEANSQIKKEQNAVPRGNWKVTREVDDQGNVERYDSIYSYAYSSLDGKEMNIEDVDSVMRSFQNYFQKSKPSSWNENMWNPFAGDSTLDENFFYEDYYQNRWRADFQDMNRRMQQMDSLRDLFFDDFYPGLVESRKHMKDSIR